MSSRSIAQKNMTLLLTEQSRTRSRLAALGVRVPGADVVLLVAAAIIAVSVFELAAWLAAAPLTALVYGLALVPLALFLLAALGEPKR